MHCEVGRPAAGRGRPRAINAGCRRGLWLDKLAELTVDDELLASLRQTIEANPSFSRAGTSPERVIPDKRRRSRGRASIMEHAPAWLRRRGVWHWAGSLVPCVSFANGPAQTRRSWERHASIAYYVRCKDRPEWTGGTWSSTR
jgi:hypothetical protein